MCFRRVWSNIRRFTSSLVPRSSFQMEGSTLLVRTRTQYTCLTSIQGNVEQTWCLKIIKERSSPSPGLTMILDSSQQLLTKTFTSGVLRTQTILSTFSRTRGLTLIVLKRVWLQLIRHLRLKLRLDYEFMLVEPTKHFERLYGEKLINHLKGERKDKQSF